MTKDSDIMNSRLKSIIRKNLYLILLVLSCALMSGAGLFLLPESGESYGEQPALVATAINRLEKRLSPPHQDIEEQSGDEDFDEAAAEDELSEEVSKVASASESGSLPNSKSAPLSSSKKSAEESQTTEKKDSTTKKKKKKNSSSKKKKKKNSSSKKKRKKKRSKDNGPVKLPDYNFIEVNETYFDDALFIGDSRQQDFGVYCGLDSDRVYADRGYQVFDTATKAVIDSPAGKLTVTDALSVNQHRFKKVYIMFGVNELNQGYDSNAAIKYYYDLIHEIKRYEPDAIIYLEGLIHVTKELSDFRPSISNEKINERNEVFKKIAVEEDVVYLDFNELPAFTDQNGAMINEATPDGVHLYSGYNELIKQYIMTHAIPYEYKGDDYPYIELNDRQIGIKEMLDKYYEQAEGKDEDTSDETGDPEDSDEETPSDFGEDLW